MKTNVFHRHVYCKICPRFIRWLHASITITLIAASVVFYATFRQNSWFGDILGVHSRFLNMHVPSTAIEPHLHDSFPSFAWTFVFSSLISQLWSKTYGLEKTLWIATPILIAVSWELGQHLAVVPGTSSLSDLSLSLLAFSFVHCLNACSTSEKNDNSRNNHGENLPIK
jgi:hypothetical protein